VKEQLRSKVANRKVEAKRKLLLGRGEIIAGKNVHSHRESQACENEGVGRRMREWGFRNFYQNKGNWPWPDAESLEKPGRCKGNLIRGLLPRGPLQIFTPRFNIQRALKGGHRVGRGGRAE